MPPTEATPPAGPMNPPWMRVLRAIRAWLRPRPQVGQRLLVAAGATAGLLMLAFLLTHHVDNRWHLPWPMIVSIVLAAGVPAWALMHAEQPHRPWRRLGIARLHAHELAAGAAGAAAIAFAVVATFGSPVTSWPQPAPTLGGLEFRETEPVWQPWWGAAVASGMVAAHGSRLVMAVWCATMALLLVPRIYVLVLLFMVL